MPSLYPHEVKKISQGVGAASGFAGFFFPSLRARGLGEEKPIPPYSAIVYKEDDEVRADDWKGRKIASGQAGVDDVSVIQEAVDLGGLIYIAPGRYIGTDGVNKYNVFIRKDNTILKGSGKDTTILEMGITLGTNIEGSSAPKTSNIELADLTIDGSNFPDAGSAIGYRNVECAIVRNVKVFAVPFWNVIGAFESGVPKSKSLYLIDCEFDRNWVDRGNQDMTAFNYLEELYVKGCIFKNNDDHATFLPYSYVDYIHLDDCIFEHITAYRGLDISMGDPKGSVKIAFVRDVKLIDVGVNAITPSEYAYISDVKLLGSDTQACILYIGGKLCEACDIQGIYRSDIHLMPWGHDGSNYVAGKVIARGCSVDNIELTITSNSIPDNIKVELYDVTIRAGYGGNGRFGCPVNNNLTTARKIYLYMYECNFEGELHLHYYEPSTAVITYRGMIKRCRSPKLRLGQKVAIEFVENDFDNVQYSSTYTDVGAVFRRNKSPKTENSGSETFNGDGSTTQFIIAHGLASEPSKVQVTPMTEDAAGDFYVTKDATNIYVNYLSAPPSGSNNVKLSWYAEV